MILYALRRLIVAPAAILTGAVCFVPAACVGAASAAERTVLFYDQTSVVKPRSVDSEKIVTRTGGPPYDETIYHARKLKWRGWGSRRAVGTGKVTFCVIEYIPCKTRKATVVLTGPRIDGCGDVAERAYRWVRWNFPGHRSARIEAAPSC